MPIEITLKDIIKEIPNLHVLPQSFGDMISSIKIEGWSSSSEFNKTVFEDEFYSDRMKLEWRWVDPKGGGAWAARQGYLEINADRNQDLNPGHGGNFDAPRLVMQVSGDFAIETRLKVYPQLTEHGGLLVWKSPEAFLKLEKTAGAHNFKGDARFERIVNGVSSLVGRASGFRNIQPCQAFVAAPLRSRKKIMGVITADNAFNRPITDEGIEILQTFADQANLMIVNSRPHAQMEEQLITVFEESHMIQALPSALLRTFP